MAISGFGIGSEDSYDPLALRALELSAARKRRGLLLWVGSVFPVRDRKTAVALTRHGQTDPLTRRHPRLKSTGLLRNRSLFSSSQRSTFNTQKLQRTQQL